MARYPGRNSLLYISTSGAGVASVVLALNAWDFNRETDKIDVTAFNDANKVYVQGLADVQGSFSGFWDDTETKIFTAADSATPVNVYMYPSINKMNSYHYGTAWLSASMKTTVAGAIEVSGSFAAGGSWGRVGI